MSGAGSPDPCQKNSGARGFEGRTGRKEPTDYCSTASITEPPRRRISSTYDRATRPCPIDQSTARQCANILSRWRPSAAYPERLGAFRPSRPSRPPNYANTHHDGSRRHKLPVHRPNKYQTFSILSPTRAPSPASPAPSSRRSTGHGRTPRTGSLGFLAAGQQILPIKVTVVAF